MGRTPANSEVGMIYHNHTGIYPVGKSPSDAWTLLLISGLLHASIVMMSRFLNVSGLLPTQDMRAGEAVSHRIADQAKYHTGAWLCTRLHFSHVAESWGKALT